MEYRLDTFVEQEYKLSENICLVIEEQEIYVEVDSIHFPLSKEILENKLTNDNSTITIEESIKNKIFFILKANKIF